MNDTEGDGIFAPDGRRARFYERKWILGLVMAFAFCPGLFADPADVRIPIWILNAVMLAVYSIALWCVGYYRRAAFDKTTGRFTFESGFFVPWTRAGGNLSEVESVRLASPGTVRSTDPPSSVYKLTLSFRYNGIDYLLGNDSSVANDRIARALSTLVGCPIERT